jgi:hypothetical protein
MPPKGFRSLSEDTISVSTRVPLSLMPAVEAHTARLRRQTPYLKVSQADALRDLLIRGLQSIAPQLDLFGEEGQTQPSRPLANVEQVADQIVETAQRTNPAPGMKWCAKELHQYPMVRKECPECARLRKRNQRVRATEQTQT